MPILFSGSKKRKMYIMSSQFKPSANYKEKIIKSFNQQGVMKTINASILAIRPGEIEFELPYQSNSKRTL